MSCSSSSGSEDDEGIDSYRKGGYHAVRIADHFAGGRYVAQRKLGWGQFSTVWLAYDTRTSKYVSLKIQKSAPQFAEAALHEIEVLSVISDSDPSSSKCIVQLIDHFKHAGPNGQHLCMVLEFLGDSLLRLIKYNRYRVLELNKVREICKCILVALDYLHRELNIIHTDLKPENILLLSTIDPTKDPVRSGQAPILERPEGNPNGGTTMNLIEKKLKRRARRAVSRISERRVSMGGATPKPEDRKLDGIDLRCKIVDFGNACWADRQFMEEIQTRQYRAPEVILQSGYSYSVAPLSVLAPLSVIQLPGALLLERVLIGRRFSGAQLTALLGLLAGCALLVVSIASPAYAQPSGLDPFDIMHYFTTVPFLVLLGIMFVVSTLSCVYGQWLVCRAKRLPTDAPTARAGPSRDLAAFMATLPIAVLCAVAIIFLKLLAEIVRSRVLGLWWDMLDILPIALGIFGGAAVALAWLMLDAACFKFDPVEILPSLQACWLLFTMLAGGLMFEEFDQQTELWQSACYLTGLFLAAICSLFLTASILCRPIGGPAPAPAPVAAAGASKGVPDLAAPRSAQNIVDSIDQSRKQRWWPCTIFVVFPAPPFFDVDEIGRLQARAAAQAPRRPSQAYAAPL